MTPQELSDIDRQVAEAIGLPVVADFFGCKPSDFPHVTIYDTGELVYWSEPYCDGEPWRPSTSWESAMFAAEKAGLFASKTDGVTIMFHGEKHWSVLLGELLVADTTPQLALCRGLLRMKGK